MLPWRCLSPRYSRHRQGHQEHWIAERIRTKHVNRPYTENEILTKTGFQICTYCTGQEPSYQETPKVGSEGTQKVEDDVQGKGDVEDPFPPEELAQGREEQRPSTVTQEKHGDGEPGSLLGHMEGLGYRAEAARRCAASKRGVHHQGHGANGDPPPLGRRPILRIFWISGAESDMAIFVKERRIIERRLVRPRMCARRVAGESLLQGRHCERWCYPRTMVYAMITPLIRCSVTTTTRSLQSKHYSSGTKLYLRN